MVRELHHVHGAAPYPTERPIHNRGRQAPAARLVQQENLLLRLRPALHQLVIVDGDWLFLLVRDLGLRSAGLLQPLLRIAFLVQLRTDIALNACAFETRPAPLPEPCRARPSPPGPSSRPTMHRRCSATRAARASDSRGRWCRSATTARGPASGRTRPGRQASARGR